MVVGPTSSRTTPAAKLEAIPKAHLLVGLTVLGSVLDIVPGPAFFPGRSGLFFASMLTGVLLVRMGVWRGGWWSVLWAEHRALLIALGLVTAAHLASAASASPAIAPMLSVARILLVEGFALAVVVSASRDHEGLRRILAYSATLIVALQAAAFAMGIGLPSLRHTLFLSGHHQSIGTFPRFVGVSNSPFGCGVVMLICAGLVQGLPRPPLRDGLRALALLLAISTVSTATLTLPMIVVWRHVRGRCLRFGTVGMLLALGTVALYVHPLTLSVGPARHDIGRLHPGYTQKNLGPTHMPVRNAVLGPLELTYHPTGYYYLARGALRCFAEAPLVGVGGRNFERRCQVTTMGMFGDWLSGYRPHNQYLALLAEQGLIGACATLALSLVLVRHYRWTYPHGWIGALLAGYLLSGCWGDDIFYQLPFCALLMSGLARVGP